MLYRRAVLNTLSDFTVVLLYYILLIRPLNELYPSFLFDETQKWLCLVNCDLWMSDQYMHSMSVESEIDIELKDLTMTW